MQKMRQLNIRISDDEYDRIKRLAFESRITISDLIRDLLTKEEQKRKKKNFNEACAFGRQFAQSRDISEKEVIDAIMESRYGKDWK